MRFQIGNFRFKYLALLVSLLALLSIFLYFQPAGVVRQMLGFPYGALLYAFGLIILNQLVVIYRYYRILRHFGTPLDWRLVFRASAFGNVTALLVIPLVGQVAGRQVLLQGTGVTAAQNAGIAAYERVMVGLLSLMLAACGAVYLFGTSMGGLWPDIDAWQIAALVLVAMVLGLSAGASRFERSMMRMLFSGKNALRVSELIIITLISLGLMLLSFAILFGAVFPEGSLPVLLSIAAIVSFAAGLPISFGGWGLREFASIYILGLMGVEVGAALAASIVSGLLSTLAVLLLGAGAFVIRRKVRRDGSTSPVRRPLNEDVLGMVSATASVEHVAAWLLCFATALLIPFQVHVPVGETVVNVNLADPFALLALAAVVLESWFRRDLPGWRIAYWNGILLAMGVAVLYGLFRGWQTFGGSAWGSGKALGWIVLYGYLLTGYLCVSYFGFRGFRRLLETLVLVLSAIIVFQAIARLLEYVGFISPSGYLGYFQGYSGNRNAFAFQILAVMSVFLVFISVYGRRLRSSASGFSAMLGLPTLGMAVLSAGMLLTASRTGIAAACVVLAVSVTLRRVSVRTVLVISSLGLIFWAVLVYGPDVYAWFSAVGHLPGAGAVLPGESAGQAMQPGFSSAESDNVRWALAIKAFDVWLQSPLLGTGLGYFYDASQSLMGVPIVIHSTGLWLLVELGLLGMLPFLAALGSWSLWAWRNRAHRAQAGALLLLLSFAMMSVFHEMLYQRIFWFLAGGLLALGWSGHRAECREGS